MALLWMLHLSILGPKFPHPSIHPSIVNISFFSPLLHGTLSSMTPCHPSTHRQMPVSFIHRSPIRDVVYLDCPEKHAGSWYRASCCNPVFRKSNLTSHTTTYSGDTRECTRWLALPTFCQHLLEMQPYLSGHIAITARYCSRLTYLRMNPIVASLLVKKRARFQPPVVPMGKTRLLW